MELKRIRPPFLLLLLFSMTLHVGFFTGVMISADAPAATGSSLSQAYNPEDQDYFFEIAFGAEYGAPLPVQHKWAQDVRIQVKGVPTPADLRALDQVIADVNALLNGITVSVDSTSPNMEMYFIPESRFSSVEPNYVPTNYGFFWVWWDQTAAINRARILITSEGITQQERSHLIREELTQSLGLFRDSWRYPESIFYQGWTDTTEYAPEDRATISLLYEPALRPGMTRSQVRDILIADQ